MGIGKAQASEIEKNSIRLSAHFFQSQFSGQLYERLTVHHILNIFIYNYSAIHLFISNIVLYTLAFKMSYIRELRCHKMS